MIDIEILMKLQTIAKGLYRDMRGDKDYPFANWEGQYAELRECFEKGQLSTEYINFAYDAEKEA